MTWVAKDTIARTYRDRMTDMCIALRKKSLEETSLRILLLKELRIK